jgi:hypothetical protein
VLAFKEWSSAPPALRGHSIFDPTSSVGISPRLTRLVSDRNVQEASWNFAASDLAGLRGVENLRGSAMEWPDIVESGSRL